MFYLTPEGKEKLEHELNGLIVRRPEVSARIGRAKEMGDLKENADYHDAKDEQGMMEARIREIQDILTQAQVVKKGESSSVTLGSKITVVVKGLEKEYEIVGGNEANPMQGKISNESPLGRGLLGHKQGESIEVSLPAGKVTYEIKKVL